MPRTTPKRRLEVTAYHEAGHAVVAVKLGVKVKRVDIIPAEDRVGVCESGSAPPWLLPPDMNFDRRTRSWVEQKIMVLLAGPIAERIFTGRRNHVLGSSDYRAVVRLTDYVCGSAEQAEAFIRWLGICTTDRLEQPLVWAQVEAVARGLLERRELSGREVRRLCQSAWVSATSARTGEQKDAA